MKCPNPSCPGEDKPYPQKNGKWQCPCGGWTSLSLDECQACNKPEEGSIFTYRFRDHQLWYTCRLCGTQFRPSKTANGLEVHR